MTQLDIFLQEATRKLGRADAHHVAWCQQVIRHRAMARNRGRRAPAPLSWVDRLEEISKKIGVPYVDAE